MDETFLQTKNRCSVIQCIVICLKCINMGYILRGRGEKGTFPTLLVRMYVGAATMEHSMEVP